MEGFGIYNYVHICSELLYIYIYIYIDLSYVEQKCVDNYNIHIYIYIYIYIYGNSCIYQSPSNKTKKKMTRRHFEREDTGGHKPEGPKPELENFGAKQLGSIAYKTGSNGYRKVEDT